MAFTAAWLRGWCSAGLAALLLACAAPEYTRGEPSLATGRAPKVRVHVLSEQNGRRTMVIAFGPGDDVLAGIAELARTRGWRSAHFSGIGSFSNATLGWYDFERKAFAKIPKHGTLEVVSFSGNVALDEKDAPLVHVHCAVADERGAVTGGHLLDATVAATLEVFLVEEPTAVQKMPDEALGSKVIR
jgi:predicted DNA-binding protein with PD1-like motif